MIIASLRRGLRLQAGVFVEGLTRSVVSSTAAAGEV